MTAAAKLKETKQNFCPTFFLGKKREWARKEKEEAKVEKARKNFQMFILAIG